jgi:hypothetical protein
LFLQEEKQKTINVAIAVYVIFVFTLCFIFTNIKTYHLKKRLKKRLISRKNEKIFINSFFNSFFKRSPMYLYLFPVGCATGIYFQDEDYIWQPFDGSPPNIIDYICAGKNSGG